MAQREERDEREERDDWELQVETCRVEVWRGYLTSSFIARLRDGDEAGTVVETSSSFRWRSARAPDTEEARLAHHELVSRLKRTGWSPSGESGEWYETELARPTLVPPRPAPAEEPAALPSPLPVDVATPVAPEPAPATAAAPRRDRWRAIAVAGLVAAVVFLVLLGLHG